MADETTNTHHTSETSVPEAFQRLLAQLPELREYATYFVSAKTDQIKVRARTSAAMAVYGLLGLMILTMVLGTAVVLLLAGLAGGLAVLLQSGLWLGNTIIGLVVLVVVALGVYLGIQKWHKSAAVQTEEYYEQRQQQQQLAFGHTVAQRARGTAE
jgi:hypothetical protein